MKISNDNQQISILESINQTEYAMMKLMNAVLQIPHVDWIKHSEAKYHFLQAYESLRGAIANVPVNLK